MKISKTIRKLKKEPIEVRNTINGMKTTLKGLNTTLDDFDTGKISDLEDRIIEINQQEKQKS